MERTFKALRNEEDSLKEKLVNLYILEALLIPKQQPNHINLKHLDILDHEETFKHYPRGRLSYILTYQFFKKASYNAKNIVYLQGFFLVLVYWAFETIPKNFNLNVGFGRKLGIQGPTIIAWKCLELSDWRTLNMNIF